MRKFARLDAPRRLVQEVFRDVASWPKWMPGVRRVEILEQEDERLVAEIGQDFGGRFMRQTLEVRFRPDGLVQRQLAGRLKRWDLEWQFLAAPELGGTTLVLDLEIELGLAGLFVSGRRVQAILDRLFDELVAAAEDRAAVLLAERDGASPEDGAPPLVQVFETPQGLELHYDGRVYELHPVPEQEAQDLRRRG